jgi:dCTP diphosphatase
MSRSIADLQELVKNFASERAWERFLDPKNLSMAIATEAGELAAILRWIPSDKSDEIAQANEVKARIEREIGDVAIVLLLLCDRIGIDFSRAIEAKLKINEVNYPVSKSTGLAERP